MKKQEAKRLACAQAASLLLDQAPSICASVAAKDTERMESAIEELAEELYKRAGVTDAHREVDERQLNIYDVLTEVEG